MNEVTMSPIRVCKLMRLCCGTWRVNALSSARANNDDEGETKRWPIMTQSDQASNATSAALSAPAIPLNYEDCAVN